MKRFVVLFLCVVMLFSCSIVGSAYEYPRQFWAANEEYEAAINKNDDYGIVTYGMQIINLMKNAPDGMEKRNTLVSRYHQVGLAYARLGDYETAGSIFRTLYEYVKSCGNEFYDYLKSAPAYAAQFTPEITMYTDRGTSPNYHAVNEKENGILFGTCSNGDTRKKLENESMVLTYQELGEKLLSYNVDIVRKASSQGLAVEFALNCPKEGDNIRSIRNLTSYLKAVSDLFARYPDVPVYLRFAAEFDIWQNLCSAEEFKDAFRYVSRYFKDRNSNVAMVWSPSQASNWYVNIHDYYPGDEYVDWVGVSLYAKPYFQGKKNQAEELEIVYKTGINSNPVIAIRDLVETYGDRKPIMLSESGCCHKLLQSGEDTGDFALRRLQEYLSYLPMVYPQIKLMAYFDFYVEGSGEREDYRLSSNKTLQNEYLRLTKKPRFIQNGYRNTTSYSNRPMYDGIHVDSVFELSCYAHWYHAQLENVAYYIDGQYITTSYEVPFTAMIDAGKYSGTHRVKAIATFDNGKTLATEVSAQIGTAAGDITVEISDREIRFDCDPILYQNRTLVPMRKIFEELGADVTWNQAEQKVTGKKGGRTVSVVIGQKEMQVNNTTHILDTPPLILSGRTLVPVRAIAEGLGASVSWDEGRRLVSIEPKVFQWSEWDDDLPSYVNEDMYFVEEREEYRYRTREEEYFTLDYHTNRYQLVDSDVYYGSWSNWQNEWISSDDNLEVETRTVEEPKSYHYAHYCTGNIADKENRYSTWDRWWHEECDYHDLGWFDQPLPTASDNAYSHIYYVNGEKYRCSNTCYRWYLMETSGGNYTQYRSRSVEWEYTYWTWGDWSGWSSWSKNDPGDWLNRYSDGVDIQERIVYRYKEKG